ncbi:TlpA disulfide reductase family protein [Rhodoferax sp. GW822-FHT02A01]|uniref:TlpA family protein disulfide reductase n=1 Tax=Rhodoferax sp. GW822-FHT02A01 TaxID=3141537 RepID=UPI00315CD432
MVRAHRRTVLRALALSPLAGVAHAASTDAAHWSPWPASRRTPSLTLPTLDGATWDLTQVKGQAVLLNFWATWCEPCRAEMPSLQALQKQYRDRNLLVVAVNFRESRDAVQRYRDVLGLDFMVLRDSYGDVSLAWGVRTFPTSLLIDRAGRAQWSVQGEVDWADSAVRQKIETRL